MSPKDSTRRSDVRGYAELREGWGPYGHAVLLGLAYSVGSGFSEPQQRGLIVAVSQTRGSQTLEGLEAPVRHHLKELASFVRSLSFAGLVSAVYKAYPEMRANSVFNG